jgi:hypothetical protein
LTLSSSELKQLLALAQAGHFALGMHQRQQGLGGFGAGRVGNRGNVLGHVHGTVLDVKACGHIRPATRRCAAFAGVASEEFRTARPIAGHADQRRSGAGAQRVGLELAAKSRSD